MMPTAEPQATRGPARPRLWMATTLLGTLLYWPVMPQGALFLT
jgi:hypothetical protein